MSNIKATILSPNIEEYKDFYSFVSDLLINNDDFSSFNKEQFTILPGFCDVHVHLREPGFFYKETIKTGTLAAAHGGFTDICSMPNLNPVTDSVENLKLQQDIIKKDAIVNVYPFASITKKEQGKELVDFEELLKYSEGENSRVKCNLIGFSDDGKGVQDEKLMEEAMKKVKNLNSIISAHCEVNDLLKGGYINEGEYSKINNHRGISNASEYEEIRRDVNLAQKTQSKYHVCHVSTKEGVDIIREGKKRGVDVTCETCPHYLILTEDDLREDGRFKMNPPLRKKEDQEALIKGILDKTIDIIVTDHAPHSKEEKSKGLEKSAFGIVGLETSFPLMYTYFVRENKISMETLMDLMIVNPRKRFNIEFSIKDFTIWDLNSKYKIDPNEFYSKGRATPFENTYVYGKCVNTVIGGKKLW